MLIKKYKLKQSDITFLIYWMGKDSIWVGNGLRIQAFSCTVFGVQISAIFVKYNLDIFTGVKKENLLPLLEI